MVANVLNAMCWVTFDLHFNFKLLCYELISPSCCLFHEFANIIHIFVDETKEFTPAGKLWSWATGLAFWLQSLYTQALQSPAQTPNKRCVCAPSLQSCLTLCDPMNCSPPGSSVHGILQARIPEWLAMPFSMGFSWLRDGTWVFSISSWQLDSLPTEPLGKRCRE